MASRQDLPVIVGVDGSSASLAAADFAVDEATLRKSALRILYGHMRHPSPSLWRSRKEPYVTRGIGRLLEAVADRARTRGPAIDVGVDLMYEDPRTALVERSGHAQLVVVGHSGRGGAALGSVAGYVASHARSPVIVHRPITGVRHESPPRPVMVGVDGSVQSAAAVEFALDEAALRGADLTAVFVWTHPRGAEPAGLHPVAYDYGWNFRDTRS